MSLSSLKVWECFVYPEISSKDPCHPKSRMITPLRTNMEPENHPIEKETHMESEPNLHDPFFHQPTESPKATSLKPPLVVRHKLLKKKSRERLQSKIQKQKKMDDNARMSVHPIVPVYICIIILLCQMIKFITSGFIWILHPLILFYRSPGQCRLF